MFSGKETMLILEAINYITKHNSYYKSKDYLKIVEKFEKIKEAQESDIKNIKRGDNHEDI